MGLTRNQHDVLLLPIKAHRVGKKDGQSHVEAYDIRAHLDRVFGFAEWSADLVDLTMLYEQSKGEGDGVKWRAAYRATVRLCILATGATYTESAVGANWGWNADSKRDEAHDFAIKMATSQALKRAAMNLGDQFGLSLYNKGSLGPLVGQSLVVPDSGIKRPAGDEGERDLDIDGHITEQLAPEDAPAEPAEQETAETSTPPPPVDTPARQAADTPDVVDDIRTRALAATKKVDLARLLAEAGQKKVAGSLTADADGKGMTLETLINARIKQIGRAA